MVGTKPLPSNGSSISGIGRLLAVATFLVTMASTTDSQVIAKVNMASTPTTPSQSGTEADGRAPISNATTVTTAIARNVCTIAPSTCPVSTETRAMAMVLNLAMMPSVMSMATEMAVPCAAPAILVIMMPGTR
ncbi:hypothetical protein GCM10010412_099040 [Nonomuraea recticatena]|uniref:Uncharacterized protein n=1 Tax=Nonomuraea recticatena TaxID=46178 RepID=A0ABN3TF39_9ACTN